MIEEAVAEIGDENCIANCTEGGEYQLDQLSDALPRYGEALLWAEKRFDSQNGVETLFEVDGQEVWDDFGIGGSVSLTVHEDVEMENIADLLEAEMYEQVRSEQWDFVREVIQKEKWALAKIGLGLGGTAASLSYALGNGDPLIGELGAGISATIAGDGWKMLHNEYGPRDVYKGVKHIVKERELPPRGKHEELVDGAMDDLYIIDIEYLEPDLGDLDEIVEQYGPEELEEMGYPIDPETYDMINKKLDSDLEGAKYLKLVWDPTEDKKYLQQVIGESFVEQEFNHPADLFASEYGHTPNGYA